MRKLIECIYCHESEHFACRSVIENALRRLLNQPYCNSVDCHKLFQSPVLEQIQAVLTELRETRNEMKPIEQTVSEVEKFQCFLSDKLATLLSVIKSSRIDHTVLKSNVESLATKQHGNIVSTILKNSSIMRTVIIVMPMKYNGDLIHVASYIVTSVGCRLLDGAVVEVKRSEIPTIRELP